jgi:hypothetical protein
VKEVAQTIEQRIRVTDAIDAGSDDSTGRKCSCAAAAVVIATRADWDQMLRSTDLAVPGAGCGAHHIIRTLIVLRRCGWRRRRCGWCPGVFAE